MQHINFAWIYINVGMEVEKKNNLSYLMLRVENT